MKKILSAIIILTALTGISYADIVYTTSDSLGLIRVDSVTSVDTPVLRYTNLGGDPLVGSYMARSEPYIMVVDRASNYSGGDTALIFKTSDLTSPEKSLYLKGVYDTKKFASSYNGRSIFFASRGNVSIVEFDTTSIDVPINAYTYINDSEDQYEYEYEPELIDMSVGSSYIYAMFRTSSDKVELFAFDGQLKEGVKNMKRGTIRNDAANLSSLTSGRFAIGADEGISIASHTSIRTLTSTDYPVKSICSDTGDGLYFMEYSESGEVNLCHYHPSTKVIGIVDSMQGTSDCQLVKDSSYNVLAALTGDSIYLYDMTTDELIASFDSSSLGGTPLNMTASRAIYDDGSSSSSNCDVSCMGAIMMIVLGVSLMRRKR